MLQRFNTQIRNKFRQIFILWMLLLPNIVSATPREIIIIRHADKLDQEEAGPALTAQGVMRSIKFAFYFLDKFGEPDFIIAADDQKSSGKEIAIRSIQTVAPLANMMQIRNPENDFPIIHPYPSDSYDELAKHLLGQQKFDDKVILVCWSHRRIAKLVAALGVAEPLPSWPREDYDTVYVLKFNNIGNVIKFTQLKNQFPVRHDGSWQGLRDKLFAS